MLNTSPSTTSTTESGQKSAKFSVLLKFALRELRGGLSGFYIFLACIALGVAAIAGVNSVARSITDGISAEGQKFLGGDISLSLMHRPLSEDEANFIKASGEVVKITTTRTMARLNDGSDQTLVELKSVEDSWPLYGKLETATGIFDIASLGANEVLTDPLLLERLNLSVGDQIMIGNADFIIRDTIANEPDRISQNIGFGPKVLMNRGALSKTELLRPGSLVRDQYNIRLEKADAGSLEKITETAKKQFKDSGWRVRSRDNAAPALTRNIDRFSQFLTLVGLAALIVGGVGIANAVRAFLETKQSVIATFKSLGASGSFIFNLYLLQIMVIAMVGVVIGVTVGMFLPELAKLAFSDIIPLSKEFAFYPSAITLAVVFGLLTTAVFAILPLAIAREISPSSLFRSEGHNDASKLHWPIIAVLILLAAILATLAIFTSENRMISTVFVVAIGFSFVLLRLVAIGIQWLAKRFPKVRSTALRMAIANIHRRGSLTPSVVLSLGLGLALLVALSSIDANLRSQVSGNLPKDAPDFFFVDIQNSEMDSFRTKLKEVSPEGKVVAVPMLRGRITQLKGIAAEDYEATEGQWVLRGDRGITYAKNMPENSSLAEGEWWPQDYAGKPLISFSEEEANELGLAVGDMLKVNVLGRTIEAEIANLRRVEWESMGINFVMVFSPNTFAGAPHAWLATLLTNRETRNSSDGSLLKEITNSFPSVTSVRVRDALDIINTLIGQLATAIRGAASVTLLTSILVLGGALAAGNNSRIHDSVILKTLGATRWMLVRSYVYEYAILGLATAIFALAAGSLAAWFVIAKIMDFPFEFFPSIIAGTIGTALVLTVTFGLIGTWRILGHKAAPVLREL